MMIEHTPIYVIAHLYDNYGQFLIGLTTKEKAKQYGYYDHAQYDSVEQAEGYVRICLDRIERQSKSSYDNGYVRIPKQSRGSYSYFLRDVFRKDLEKIKYNGWIEVA